MTPLVTLRSHLPGFGRFALAMGIGLAGGFAFAAAGLPLPFLLGSMAFCMIAALLRIPIETPKPLRGPMVAIIGAMLGTAFTAGALADMWGWIATIAALALFLSVAGVVSTLIIWRVFGYDLRTAYFCGMPGGLNDMVVLGDHYGANIRQVSLIHAVRIFLIVFSMPVLIGMLAGTGEPVGAIDGPRIWEVGASFYFWFALTIVVGIGVGHLIRLPAPFILGPMLASAVVHIAGWSDYKLPVELVIMAQVVLGAGVGGRFSGVAIGEILRIAGVGAGTTAVLLALTIGFAWATGAATGRDPVAILLAFSPGGFAEMGLVALSLGIDTAFVAGHHIARIAMVSFGAAFLFRLWQGPPSDRTERD